MFEGIILGLGIAGAIFYVHKVGLPKVLTEIQAARVEVVAAINRHAARPTPTLRPNPLPANAVSYPATNTEPGPAVRTPIAGIDYPV